jgi:pimeloyl-ACP methyl ester carboxylesterase
MVMVAAAVAIAASLLQPCRVAGVRRPALCGTVEVHENPADTASRTIGLNVAMFPSRSRNRRPDSLFIVAGGPGQGAVSVASILMEQLRGVEGDRDVVLFDARGTGSSNPLKCPEPHLVLRGVRNAEFDACLAAIRQRADLRYYTTAEAVEDIESVRRALGYDRISLLGISYGTRVAAEYIVRYGSNVRAAVLRGALPFGANILLDTARANERALQRLLDDCRTERECGSAFPRLRLELASVEKSLSGTGERVRVRGQTLEINYELFRDLLYSMAMHDSSRRSVPLVIHQLAQRGPRYLPSIAIEYLSSFDEVAAGAYYAVICAEDDARLSEAEQLEVDRLQRRSGRADDRCAGWAPRPAFGHPLPASRGEGAEVPALVISGTDDPATPPESGAALARQLGAAHIVLPETSHAPLFPGCARGIARDFLDAASAAKLQTRCLRTFHRLPFVVR